MNFIDGDYYWEHTDDVVSVHKRGGRLSAQVYRGMAISFFILLGLAGILTLALIAAQLTDLNALGSALPAVLFILLFAAITHSLLEGSRTPYRIELSPRGLELCSLSRRQHYSIDEIESLRSLTYTTHSEVPNQGSKLVADLWDGTTVVVIDAKQSDATTSMQPIIEVFSEIVARSMAADNE